MASNVEDRSGSMIHLIAFPHSHLQREMNAPFIATFVRPVVDIHRFPPRIPTQAIGPSVSKMEGTLSEGGNEEW